MGKIDIGKLGFKDEGTHIFKNKHRSQMVGFAESVIDTKFLSGELRKYLEDIFAGKSIFSNEEALDYLVSTKDGLEIIKYAVAMNVKHLVVYNNESNNRYAYLLSNGNADVFAIREDNYLSFDLYSPVNIKERIETYNNLIDYLSKKIYPMDGTAVYDLGGEIMGYTPLYGGMSYQEKMQDNLKIQKYKDRIQILTDQEDIFQGVQASYDLLKQYFEASDNLHSDEAITIPKELLSRTLVKKTKNTRVYNTKQDI